MSVIVLKQFGNRLGKGNMIRLTQEQNNILREEYYDDPLFVTLTDAIDELETQHGGLTPEEVWKEVLRIKEILLKTKRADKTIQQIRTELEKDYQIFESPDKKDTLNREPLAAEWTSIVVLTCLIHYLCTATPVPDKNLKLAVKVRKLIWDHPAYTMMRRLQKPAETEEEENGNPVPNEDRLHPLTVEKESPEMQEMRERLTPAVAWFINTLIAGKAVNTEYMTKTDGNSRFWKMWMDMLKNEGILRTLSIKTLETKDFKEGHAKYHEAATTTHYNLKLVLNIIGIMKTEGVIKMSDENMSNLFFTKLRTMYFSSNNYSAYGKKGSALNANIHNDIISIIQKYKT